jgi:hypothetical protein
MGIMGIRERSDQQTHKASGSHKHQELHIWLIQVFLKHTKSNVKWSNTLIA